MNLQMSEGLQLNSHGFPSRAGRAGGGAPEVPGVPASTVSLIVKMRRR